MHNPSAVAYSMARCGQLELSALTPALAARGSAASGRHAHTL